ncbi:uncharacterized protein gvin1l2 [Festucalex cinctus]
MSTKLSKRLSSKRKKPPKNKIDVLTQLGLDPFYPSQLEPASILDLSTWILDNLTPRETNDLPKSFLQRLWLLRPDARSTCCKALTDIMESPGERAVDFEGFHSCTINPLDLVTAVFLCANTFLQQEITAHMLQCQFAVPLILPHLNDEEPSNFLLWPVRGVVRQWQAQSLNSDQKVQEAVLASTSMPVISCVRLGSCSVSKSEVLNHVFGSETFPHEKMDGGQVPRRLSEGLVETAWYLPTGDPIRDTFPVPVVFSNLRGDASTHEKCLQVLSQVSSVVIFFCENPKEKEKQLIASCKNMTSKLILIDRSETDSIEDRAVRFIGKNIQEAIGLPDGSVVSGRALNAENLANVLCDTIKHLLPDLRLVTLEEAAKLAIELGLHCDEGTVCKKSMHMAEEVLNGLAEGPTVFREKQLPLQGGLWSRLAEIEKEESRKKKEGKVFDPRLQNERKDIVGRLSKYKKTPSMKNFTNALSTQDKVERMYFLSWMKVKLRLLQMQKQIDLKDLLINQQTNDIPEQSELQNVVNDSRDDTDSFCTDSTFRDGEIEQHADNDQEVVDSENKVDLIPIFQMQNHDRSESLLSGHEFDESMLHKTSSAEEQMCQDVFAEDQTAVSLHSCLLRLEKHIDDNLEFAASEHDLGLKHSFQTENDEGTESLLNEHLLPPNEEEILGEDLLENNASLNSVFLENGTLAVQGTDFSASTIRENSGQEQSCQDASDGGQTVISARSFLLRLNQRIDNDLEVSDSESKLGVKHSFQTKNNDGTESLQNEHFLAPNKEEILGEDLFENNASLNSVLLENGTLDVQGTDFSASTVQETAGEEQSCQDAPDGGQTIISARSFLLRLKQRIDNDLEVADSESNLCVKHSFQTENDEGTESLQNEHFLAPNEEILGEDLFENNASLNSVLLENGTLDVQGTDFIASTVRETSGEEQTCQDASDGGQTVTSARSFLLRFKQRIDNDLEVVDADNDLALKHSFQAKHYEGTESLQNYISPLANEEEILGEDLLENNVSLNSVLLGNRTLDVQGTDFNASKVQKTSSREEQSYQDASAGGQTSAWPFLLRLKHRIDKGLDVTDSESNEGFQTQNNEESEALKHTYVDSTNQEEFLGEKILKMNVSLNPLLNEEAALCIHGNDFNESAYHKTFSTEEQTCLDASFESQTVTSAQPFLLELKQFKDDDLNVTDPEGEVGLKHIFQTKNNEESESMQNENFNSKNQEEFPSEEILKSNIVLNPVLTEKKPLWVHRNDSTFQETSSTEEQTYQNASVEDQAATSALPFLLELEQFKDNDLLVADREGEVPLKHVFQTTNDGESESPPNGHFDSKNQEGLQGEEILKNNVLNPVLSEKAHVGVHGNYLCESTLQETSTTDEQTYQSVEDQTVTSAQPFLLDLEQLQYNDHLIADSDGEIALEHVFHSTKYEESECAQNDRFESKNQEELQGEDIPKNNVSLNLVLGEKGPLGVHGNSFSDSTFKETYTTEEKSYQNASEDQAVTSAQPFLLEPEQVTDNDLVFADSEHTVGWKHIFQTPNHEESESLQNRHFDCSNEEEIPNEKILEESTSLKTLSNNGTLDVHMNDFNDTTFPETSAEQQTQHASSEGPAEKSRQPFLLGLEHFLREMALIFELTHISLSSGSHNVLRLPSVAADLILSGIPLELMDGDASNIPMRWLGSVLAEIKHRFPRDRLKVLTCLGVHHARNAEILWALFGVKFPDGSKRSTRGVYMVALQLPPKLKKKLNCDFLLLIDVEGLCSATDRQISTQVSDNEMATVGAGISEVLLQNLYSRAASELETSLTVEVNALLRIRECGSIPICKVLVQDQGINTILEATQLKRVSNILKTKTEETTVRDADTIHNSKKINSIPYVRPWYNEPLSKSVDTHHSEAILKFKRSLFGALKEAAVESRTCGWTEFMGRVCCVWEAVKAESFSVGLQNKDIALVFSIFCTELFQWEDSLVEHMECWLTQATKTIYSTEPNALDPSSQNDFLCELKYEAKREVKREVNKQKSSVKASLKENKLDVYIKMLKSIILSNMTELEDRVTIMTIERLETINENHCSSTQLNRIETVLKIEQNARLQALLHNSESENELFKDEALEEEFEVVWKEALSKFDFRVSDTEDITTRVVNILAANLNSHGLQKHFHKLSTFGQNQTTSFRVHDEYFGYSSRMKNLFEGNNKSPKAKAQQLASNIMEHYQQFVTEKVSLPQDFADSYITELLEVIDKALKETQLEIRSAFGVDLKVFVCNAACRDFQRVHNRFAKDGELLKSIKAKKSALKAEFIYQFRKQDQRQRLAHRFISDIIQPTVMDYVYRPLAMHIAQEIQCKVPQYLSPLAFHKSLLEDLINEDRFESFAEYLLSYDSFRLRKIQETVVTHLSDWNVNTWRHQRLGEIIGKVAAAVSQVTVGTSAVLTDAKPMLKQVCLILEDGDARIPWECLEGPLYSITTEWDHFITRFMELLAALRLDLAQAFSQHMGSDQLLECLPTQPRDCLFNKLKGCEARCPVCSAPCDVEQTGHQVHKASLHRPKCMLEPTSLITPESANTDELEPQEISVACWALQPLHPDWNLSPEETSSQTPSPYWRYVLARFNERFANKYDRTPPVIPEEWKAITQEEALDNLRDSFL